MVAGGCAYKERRGMKRYTVLNDGARAVFATSLISLTIMWSQADGQVVLPTPTSAQVLSMDQIDDLRWMVQQLGAFFIILVILFFYRRDWQTAVEFWKDQHALTMSLVEKATVAQIEASAVVRENTVVTHALKRVIEYCDARDGPGRRGADQMVQVSAPSRLDQIISEVARERMTEPKK